METRFKSLSFCDAFKLRSKHELHDMEEQFRKAIINNVQLDNEKQVCSYQIESLKDDLTELEDGYHRLQKDHKDKARAYDLLNRDFAKLQEENNFLLETLRQRDHLIEEHGLVLVNAEETGSTSDSHPTDNLLNGDCSKKSSHFPGDESESESGINGLTGKASFSGPALITREAAQLLEYFEGSSLEAKLRNVAQDREELLNEIKQLKIDLEDERQKNDQWERRSMSSDINPTLNGSDLIDAQRETKKLVHEYKFKLKKAEQEISTLQSSVARLETQLARYKLDKDESEKLEDELKTEKRRILRELREAQAKAEELETSNSHLQKRIDKLKSSRIAIINSN